MPTPDSWIVTLTGGERIVVPAALDVFSTFLFLEREDWYEPEAAFVRRLGRPQLRALDIGANHGFFTVALAQRAGSQGHVWSFEPDRAVNDCLRKTVAVNGLQNVTTAAFALGDRNGDAVLSTAASAEFNTLRAVPGDAEAQRVTVRRLDDVVSELGIRDIDFVKIDVEGLETAVLEGGRNFFVRESPLVMAEMRFPGGVQTELPAVLRDLGYALWRYAPGLERLVPSAGDSPDGSSANIFGCKSDRARTLAEADLLIGASAPIEITGWRGAFGRYWQGTAMGRRWVDAAGPIDAWLANPPSTGYLEALDAYAASRDKSRTAGERFAALQQARTTLVRVCGNGPSYAHLLSLARVAADLGLEVDSFQCLHEVVTAMQAGKTLQLNEPFLPLSHGHENADNAASLPAFIQVMILECHGWARYGSSYNHRDFFAMIQHIIRNGLGTPQLDRARQLCLMSWGLQAKPTLTPILRSDPAATINWHYWQNEVAGPGAVAPDQADP